MNNTTLGYYVRNKHILAFIYLILVGHFLSASFAWGQGRVIKDIELNTLPEGTEVIVRFDALFQYVSHSPKEKTDILQIKLRAVNTPGTSSDDLLLRERRSLEPGRNNPVLDVTYDGEDPDGPYLIFRFREEVNFQITRSADLRAFGIFVPSPEMRDESQPPPIQRGETKESKAEGMIIFPEGLTADKVDTASRYAIQLSSDLKKRQPPELADKKILEKYILYSSKHETDGQIWYRWRLGFFPNRETAQNFLIEKLKKDFSSAWVVMVPEAERKQLAHNLVISSTSKKAKSVTIAPSKTKKVIVTEKPAPEEIAMDLSKKGRFDELLLEAEKEMTSGNYRRAIQYYTKILQSPNQEHRKKALELLGLARERNGQLAHAKARYEEFLQKYPEGEEAETVKQRLAGLLTARVKPREQLRRPSRSVVEGTWQKDVWGSFSQFYTRDKSFTDDDQETLNQDLLNNDLDVTATFRSAEYDIRTVFIGGYDADFRPDREEESRISHFYIDALDRVHNISAKVGRQSSSGGGILGRFDGGILGYAITPQIKMNTVFGYPVDSTTSIQIDTAKRFYGLNFDLGTFWEHWDFNAFVINQVADSITDRRAVGGEVRYFDDHSSFFTLLDYDLIYEDVNTYLFVGNYILPNNTSINFSTDYRNSPILTTSNAIQGQGVNSIGDLASRFSEEELRALAEDRTATSTSVTLGVSHPFSEKFQISADVTKSRITSTKSSGGVDGVPGTGDEYFYSVQFIGSNLFKEGDIAILGLRYSDASTSDTYAMNLNTRYPITREWRINPRFQLDYRESKRDDSTRLKFKPSVRTDYRWRKRFRFELEAGAEWITESSDVDVARSRGYFITLGHRISF